MDAGKAFKSITVFNEVEQVKQYEKLSRGHTLRAFQLALPYLPTPITKDSIVHDNACGPGVIAKELVSRALADGKQPPKIVCTDISATMIDIVNERIETSEGWKGNVSSLVSDSSVLEGLDRESFTHSITNFGIFGGDMKRAYEVLKPGGTALITTWIVQGTTWFVNDVRDAIHPGLPFFPMGSPDMFTTQWAANTMVEGGFERAKLRQELIEFHDEYESTEEFMEMLSTPFWMTAREGLTEEEKAKWDDTVKEMIAERGLKFPLQVCVSVARK